MGAAILKTPEIAIDQKEAEMLAAAVKDVQDFYGFDASDEVIIWTNLVGAFVTVYGPRAFILMSKKGKEKSEPSKKEAPKAAPQAATPPGIPGIEYFTNPGGRQ